MGTAEVPLTLIGPLTSTLIGALTGPTSLTGLLGPTALKEPGLTASSYLLEPVLDSSSTYKPTSSP